jgi:signal transduction histidine kinase
VRACNSNGIWDRTGIVYNITQRPHYYETSLFRFAALSTFVLLVFGMYRFRLGQMALQLNARLDERIAERTRLAQDLHDTLLQTIHASSMVVHAAREGHGNPPATANALETLDRWLSRAQEEARSALNALRSSVTDADDLMKALEDAGKELTSGAGIEFRIQAEGVGRALHPVVRDEIFQIVREAIRNACRHSQGTQIEVVVNYGRVLTLRVRDNGRGIDIDTAMHGKAGHFGLRGMQERAKRIGGRLAVAGKQDGGTELELTVPVQSILRPPGIFTRLFG